MIFLIKIKAQETSSRLQAAEMPYTDTLYHTDQAQRIYEAPFSDESLIRRALYLTYQGDLVTYERMSGKGSLQSFRRPKEKISDFDSDNLDAFLEALSIMDAYAR